MLCKINLKNYTRAQQKGCLAWKMTECNRDDFCLVKVRGKNGQLNLHFKKLTHGRCGSGLFIARMMRFTVA